MSLPRERARRDDVMRANAHLAAGAPREGDPDPIGSMRAFVRRYGDLEPRPPLTGVVVTSVQGADFAAEWLVASGADTSRRLVYLHGGGWVAGDLESHRPIAASLAGSTGWAVLLVDYRLAPEHPFPAAFEDCVSALNWARTSGPGGSSPAKSLALVGDSAGGNLAAAICASGATAPPDRLVLICPALDGTVVSEEARSDGSPDAVGLAAMMQLYAQGATPLEDVRISPLRATDASLSTLPPTLLQVSGDEYLFSHSRDFAARLSKAGVRNVLSVWPDMPHVWHAFLASLPEAGEALSEVASFIRTAR